MLTAGQPPWPRTTGSRLKDGARHQTHHLGMETIRTATVNTAKAAWMRAMVPSMVLSAAIALDQYTRGPSISGMLLTYVLR